jgi:hypothetical protein
MAELFLVTHDPYLLEEAERFALQQFYRNPYGTLEGHDLIILAYRPMWLPLSVKELTPPADAIQTARRTIACSLWPGGSGSSGESPRGASRPPPR